MSKISFLFKKRCGDSVVSECRFCCMYLMALWELFFPTPSPHPLPSIPCCPIAEILTRRLKRGKGKKVAGRIYGRIITKSGRRGAKNFFKEEIHWPRNRFGRYLPVPGNTSPMAAPLGAGGCRKSNLLYEIIQQTLQTSFLEKVS